MHIYTVMIIAITVPCLAVRELAVATYDECATPGSLAAAEAPVKASYPDGTIFGTPWAPSSLKAFGKDAKAQAETQLLSIAKQVVALPADAQGPWVYVIAGLQDSGGLLDLLAEVQRHAQAAESDAAPQDVTIKGKVVLGALTLDCAPGSDDAHVYVPYVALPKGTVAAVAEVAKKQPGGAGATKGAAALAAVTAALGGGGSKGPQSTVSSGPVSVPITEPGSGQSKVSLAWPKDPALQLSATAALPEIPIPPSMRVGGGADKLYHLRLRTYRQMSSEYMAQLYMWWQLSNTVMKPKVDEQGRLELKTNQEGLVFLPLYLTSTTVTAVIPPYTSVIFAIYAQDTLPAILLHGLHLSPRSAAHMLLGPLTSACMEGGMSLQIDGLSVPNPASAPVMTNDFSVELSDAALGAALREAGGAARGAGGLAMPGTAGGNSQLTVAAAGYFFLLPGGFSQGSHRITYSLTHSCIFKGEFPLSGVLRSSGTCFPNQADCQAFEWAPNPWTRADAFSVTINLDVGADSSSGGGGASSGGGTVAAGGGTAAAVSGGGSTGTAAGTCPSNCQCVCPAH